jgi:hypothetical protein
MKIIESKSEHLKIVIDNPGDQILGSKLKNAEIICTVPTACINNGLEHPNFNGLPLPVKVNLMMPHAIIMQCVLTDCKLNPGYLEANFIK